MKKLILPAALLLALQIQSCQSNSSSNQSATNSNDTSYVDTTHNSQNALDWAGTYEGIVPCADCSGIKTKIELKDNDTFSYQAEYLEKNTTVQDSGKFMWHDNGSTVHLMSKDLNTKYKVAENKLIQLDAEGKIIEGPIAEKYYLIKTK